VLLSNTTSSFFLFARAADASFLLILKAEDVLRCRQRVEERCRAGVVPGMCLSDLTFHKPTENNNDSRIYHTVYSSTSLYSSCLFYKMSWAMFSLTRHVWGLLNDASHTSCRSHMLQSVEEHKTGADRAQPQTEGEHAGDWKISLTGLILRRKQRSEDKWLQWFVGNASSEWSCDVLTVTGHVYYRTIRMCNVTLTHKAWFISIHL